MVNSPILIADNVGDILGEAVRIKENFYLRIYIFFYHLAGCFG